jgi:zinc transport system substrate-binding protein
MSDFGSNGAATRVSRRQVLATGAGLVTVGHAGCLGGGLAGGTTPDTTEAGVGPDGDREGYVVVASFFSFFDFARTVAAGTPVEVRNLIPIGLHGHGWEPDASVVREIIEADAFVHVGPGFQPWADRAIRTLQDDGVDTQLIDVREGIDLIALDATLDPEEGVGENRGLDPHFWLDPIRAKRAVDNIVAGLAGLAPEYADQFRANGEAYKTEVLDRIDRDYRAIFEAADRKVIQLASHNAFQYLGARYGVQMRPLVTNLAASEDIRPSDIVTAKRIIEDNDIRYIGAAVFESRRPARQLVAETSVEAYFPVTPFAGVREDWVAMGWGYEEIAYNINMPTFEIVLGTKPPAEAAPYEGWVEEWQNFE